MSGVMKYESFPVVMETKSLHELYREAFALLNRAEELLLAARAKHEQTAAQKKAALGARIARFGDGL